MECEANMFEDECGPAVRMVGRDCCTPIPVPMCATCAPIMEGRSVCPMCGG